jgi:hypothetical protein
VKAGFMCATISSGNSVGSVVVVVVSPIPTLPLLLNDSQPRIVDGRFVATGSVCSPTVPHTPSAVVSPCYALGRSRLHESGTTSSTLVVVGGAVGSPRVNKRLLFDDDYHDPLETSFSDPDDF